MIKENRKEKKMTQEQLAEKIGITTRQLQRIEKREENTRLATFKKIVKELKINDKEILEFIKK